MNYSEIIIHQTIDFLFKSIWQNLALENLKQMIPLDNYEQTIYAVQSFVIIGTNCNQSSNGIKTETQTPHITPDSITPNFITKQIPEIISSIAKKKNTKQNISDAMSTISRRSHKIGKLIQPIEQSKTEEKLKQLKIEVQIQNKQQNNKRQEFHSPKRLYLQEKKINSSQQKNKTKKLSKNLTKYTFDYDGNIVGINNENKKQNKDYGVRMKYNSNQSKQNYGNSMISQKNQIKIPEKIIENLKITERNRNKRISYDKDMPNFENHKKSIIQIFKPDQISEGIKMSDNQGSNSITCNKPQKKLPSIKKYKLQQFHKYSQNNKFKQYPRTISFENKVLNRQNSIDHHQTIYNPEKIKFKQQLPKKQLQKAYRTINYDSNLKKNRSFDYKKSYTYRGLPFVNSKGYRAFDINSEKIMIEQSSSNFFGKSSQQQQNYICIQNQSLFNQNFENI